MDRETEILENRKQITDESVDNTSQNVEVLSDNANYTETDSSVNDEVITENTSKDIEDKSIEENVDCEKSDIDAQMVTGEGSILTAEQEKYEALRAEAKWYVLHTFSGYENVAKENLEIVIDKYDLQERIFDILIPMEDCIEEKNGKRKIVQRKVMPGYIIVKMIYGDDIWHAVTRTRGITGFVGPKGRPLPLTQDEILKMRLEKVAVVNIDLAIGDKVEVLEGALFGFVGEITALDIDSNKCRVLVEMFGRETPVDLTLQQIKKVD